MIHGHKDGNMKKFIISEEQLKPLISYLRKRPHEEVDAGIAMLLQLEEIKEEKTELKKVQ